MFGRSVKTGSQVVNEALKGLTDLTTKLQEGITLCDAEECKYDEEIKAAQAKKDEVSKSKQQAAAVKANVEALLKV